MTEASQTWSTGEAWSSQRREAERPGPVKFELVSNLKPAKALGLNCLFQLHTLSQRYQGTF